MGIWGARVVAVDDDIATLEVVAAVLRRHGAEVITVSSPGAALATVIGVVPDVLIVDIVMPGQDGIGLVRAVRGLSPEKGGQVPAVTLTGAELTGDRLEAWRAAGFQGHLTKPLDADVLVALVDRLAGQAVERRRRLLDRREWPRDVQRDRRAEVREDSLLASDPEDALHP
jgi:two-component system CheB/CheR fusion protein